MSPAKKRPTGPTPVEAITHDDKRANLPTADAHDFVTPEVEADLTVSYPRNLRTPMLVWEGKEAQDEAALEADAPPIYIQEKIDPRVIVERLRQTGRASDTEADLTLFESFDGLDDLDLVEFYKHEVNWSNRMILGDSLQVMASLERRERLRGNVQMIYMDPPYGIKFGSNWQVSARRRDVRDGKVEDIAREVEQIKAFRDTWELGISSYLSYLRDRLSVARDLLTVSGSIFVQIGDENLHLVRSLMDEVFGAENFAGMISFRTKIPLRTTLVPAIYDHLIWFAADLSQLKFRRLFSPRKTGAGTQFTWIEEPNGARRRLTSTELASAQPPPGRLFRLTDLVSAGRTESCIFEFEMEGKRFFPSGNKSWKTNRAGIDRLIQAERILAPAKAPSYVFFEDDYPAEELTNVWTDTQGASDRQYVVQTSTKVIERCILMTTDPGDLVVDPTCGGGTTALVAERWGRRWITIDSSRVALALARTRLMSSAFPYFELYDSESGAVNEAALTGGQRRTGPFKNDLKAGFVYRQISHITLGSITNNPDIRENSTAEEVQHAIRRHAEHEVLVDSPVDDPARVRVSGPFTIESLSPHRSLAFAPQSEPASQREAAADPQAPTFEQSILENLRVAGVQNGRKAERLTFDAVEIYAGTHIQAVGLRDEVTESSGLARVGISIGPQYGTVSSRFVKDAAREASKARDLDLVCILGFAFDPRVLGATDEIIATDESFDVAAERSLGRVPVLLVRMNSDLLMGEDLKKTGAGNLFTVFGEPDIDVRAVGEDQVEVEIKGVDVYDPTTSEVRSGGTDQVALWMIDTDYDGESFFVRHCYFTGGQDPYKRLRAALKADIDPEGWESLYRTTSRPFSRPSTGKVAVKVINDYGDEVVKVIDIS